MIATVSVSLVSIGTAPQEARCAASAPGWVAKTSAPKARAIGTAAWPTPRSALDEHGLSGRQMRTINQPLPGGNDNQRQRRGFAHRQVNGLAREKPRIHRRKFRKRARRTAHPAGHAEDMISNFEAGHAGSGLRDNPGHSDAENAG